MSKKKNDASPAGSTSLKANQAESGWMTRDRSLAFMLVAATAIALYVCWTLISPFLPGLAWALALAIIGWPLQRRIARYVPRDNVSTALTVLIITIVIVVPALALSQYVTAEAFAGWESLKSEAASGRWRAAIERNRTLGPILEWIMQHADPGADATKAIAARVSAFLSGSFWIALQLLITFFILFYFLRDRDRMVEFLRSVSPLSRSESDEIFKRVIDVIKATLFGTLVVAIIQGTLGGFIFWWLDLPAPLLWGVVMAVMAILPILGAAIVWIPAAIFLFVEGSWEKALILTAWGAIVVGLIDNLIYPILVGDRIRLHTLPVFFAIVGGIIVFGGSGLILGPLVLAVTVALLEIWRKRTADGRTVDAAATVSKH